MIFQVVQLVLLTSSSILFRNNEVGNINALTLKFSYCIFIVMNIIDLRPSSNTIACYIGSNVIRNCCIRIDVCLCTGEYNKKSLFVFNKIKYLPINYIGRFKIAQKTGRKNDFKQVFLKNETSLN